MRYSKLALFVCLVLVLRSTPLFATNHADAPAIAGQQDFDIGDLFFFLDPNDNTKAVMAMTIHGFITPSQNEKEGFFSSVGRYVFQIENTGDANPDATIAVSFAAQTARTTPQTATITLPNGQTIQAPTTLSTSVLAAANPPVVTTDPITGVSFFAGEVDDPTFWDESATEKYLNSRRANATNPSFLTRGRDSYAGYNTMAIALRVPVSLIQGVATNHLLGLSCAAQTPSQPSMAAVGPDVPAVREQPNNIGGIYTRAVTWSTVDRGAHPAVNNLLINYRNKNAYAVASTQDDANGVFASDIVANLQALQTDATSIGILANLFITKGDMLRLDLNIANTGSQGGTNPEAAYPNGRRPTDDVIDTLLTLINNRVFQADNVSANDVPLRNTFPFLAAPEVPFPAGTIDDHTRN